MTVCGCRDEGPGKKEKQLQLAGVPSQTQGCFSQKDCIDDVLFYIFTSRSFQSITR